MAVSDRKHLESIIEANERRHADLSAARDKAVDAAFVAAFEKSQMHNGLLAALEKAQDKFLPREQFALEAKSIKDQIAEIKLTLASTGGSTAGRNQLFSSLIAIVLAVGAILGMVAMFNGAAR